MPHINNQVLDRGGKWSRGERDGWREKGKGWGRREWGGKRNVGEKRRSREEKG